MLAQDQNLTCQLWDKVMGLVRNCNPFPQDTMTIKTGWVYNDQFVHHNTEVLGIQVQLFPSNAGGTTFFIKALNRVGGY